MKNKITCIDILWSVMVVTGNRTTFSNIFFYSSELTLDFIIGISCCCTFKSNHHTRTIKVSCLWFCLIATIKLKLCSFKMRITLLDNVQRNATTTTTKKLTKARPVFVFYLYIWYSIKPIVYIELQLIVCLTHSNT